MDLKRQLGASLGAQGLPYWRTLSDFFAARISRAEFEEIIKEFITSPALIELHNSFLVSLISTASQLATGPSAADTRPPRKRRRTGHHASDPADTTASRSARLKRWTLGAGKRERERIRALETAQSGPDPRVRDEINQDRGVHLRPEGKDKAGTFLPLRLASTTRSITAQHLAERVGLIAAQNDLAAFVSRPVTNFLTLALEAKLKHLITHALAQTSSSRAIASIRPSGAAPAPTLSVSAFDTVFTLTPAVLPAQSPAALRLALGAPDHDAERERHSWSIGKGAKALDPAHKLNEDPRWQLLSVLRDRSAVHDFMRDIASG